MGSERRRWPRYPFIAVTEVTESRSGTVLEPRISDLGANGCYVDTINPHPQGTVISVRITRQNRIFVARGLVPHVQANMGMGVTFMVLESGCAKRPAAWEKLVRQERIKLS